MGAYNVDCAEDLLIDYLLSSFEMNATCFQVRRSLGLKEILASINLTPTSIHRALCMYGRLTPDKDKFAN